jgi:hypothetical protein
MTHSFGTMVTRIVAMDWFRRSIEPSIASRWPAVRSTLSGWLERTRYEDVQVLNPAPEA